MKLDLRQRIDRASRWGNLRLIGNSVASRATIAVPILGYLVLFNSYVVNALTLHSSLWGIQVVAFRGDYSLSTLDAAPYLWGLQHTPYGALR
jgi:hypothetical protein